MDARRFFASQWGRAALVSIAALATFALLASMPPGQAMAAVPAGAALVERVELA